MPTNDFEDPKDLTSRQRIEELKQKASDLTNGELVMRQYEELPPGLAERFWENVVAYESAPWTTHFQQLEQAGVELPAPETMIDEQVTAKLGEMFDRLAGLRVFVSSTNHLSDRELYTILWSDVLREATKEILYDEFSAWHIDLLGSGSDEDTFQYLKYYADEKYRQDWLRSFPGYKMPTREKPPYNRDGSLPQATYGLPAEAEFVEPK